MQLPGFTAGSAVGRTRSYFNMKGADQSGTIEWRVIAQQKKAQIVRRPGFDDPYIDYCAAYQNCLTDNAFSECSRYANACLQQGGLPPLF